MRIKFGGNKTKCTWLEKAAHLVPSDLWKVWVSDDKKGGAAETYITLHRED